MTDLRRPSIPYNAIGRRFAFDPVAFNAMLAEQRYSTHGLALSAADDLQSRTGTKHATRFQPRYPGDGCPFIVKEDKS